MNTKLYVGNLSYEATEAELEGLFAQAGAVQAINIVRERETGRARGFAFVEMANEPDAQTAIERFHEQSFGGRNLTVNLAKPQAVRTGSYAGGQRGSTSRW